MNLDKDIKKKYDLRRTADRDAAEAEQLLRDQTREHEKGFKFAGWVGYIWLLFVIIFVGQWITDGKLELWEGLPFSEFAWWGWLIIFIFSVAGIASLRELFTTYLKNTIEVIVGFIVLILIIVGIVYFW